MLYYWIRVFVRKSRLEALKRRDISWKIMRPGKQKRQRVSHVVQAVKCQLRVGLLDAKMFSISFALYARKYCSLMNCYIQYTAQFYCKQGALTIYLTISAMYFCNAMRGNWLDESPVLVERLFLKLKSIIIRKRLF